MRTKWFDGLRNIAESHPEIFPIGIMNGVVLQVDPILENGRHTDRVRVTPTVAATIPEHIANAVHDLFQQLFRIYSGE